MSDNYKIRYPRRRLIRWIIRFVGRLLMRILTRPTLNGWEKLPAKGPAILVGNHVAMLEAAMMVVYARGPIELLGTGEIPFDARYRWLIHMLGFIPIKRGVMDREGLEMALDVLKQGGMLGIFPEGGIWESAAKRGKSGVSWLSAQSGAPIIPIGFGGIDGALGAAMKFKRPAVSLNVGEPIPPISDELTGKARKQALDDAAQMVMARIDELIPAEDKKRWRRITDERFELRLRLTRADGTDAPLPAEPAISEPVMLAKFFHRPLMLDVFARNLKLPVGPLQRLDTESDPAAMVIGLDAALGYLENGNPGFLSYRFGLEEGAAMQTGLRELRALAQWAAGQGLNLHITPIRRYRENGSEHELVQDKPGGVPAL